METMVPAGADSVWAEDSGGDGPVLVLLHELVADSRMWDPGGATTVDLGLVLSTILNHCGR